MQQDGAEKRSVQQQSEQCEGTSLFSSPVSDSWRVIQIWAELCGRRDCHWRFSLPYLMLNLYKDQFAVNDNPW